MSRKL
jgi:hypothetical protein